jgi:hypothetical protein
VGNPRAGQIAPASRSHLRSEPVSFSSRCTRPTAADRVTLARRCHLHACLSAHASRLRATAKRRDQAQPVKPARSGRLRRRPAFRLRRPARSRGRTDSFVSCGSPKPPTSPSGHAAEGRFFHAAQGSAEPTGVSRQMRVKLVAAVVPVSHADTPSHGKTG